MEKQVKAPPVCKKHGVQKIRSYNSTIAVCPACEREKQKQRSQDRIRHNNALLKQSHQRSKETSNTGEKTGKTDKFSIYRTPAWQWFRKYVMLTYANSDGITRCATSGRFLLLGEQDCHCGHYIKVDEGGGATNYATAFDERNVAPQYLKDNRYQGGQQVKMREFLVNRHGEQAIKELELKAKKPFRLDDLYLEKIALEYKARFHKLLKERNMKNPWKK